MNGEMSFEPTAGAIASVMISKDDLGTMLLEQITAVMASQLQGTEKQAVEKVSEACSQKNRRLKQAKVAAQAEIEQCHLQKEKEFKAKEAVVLGS
ncbi:hypothetical protein P7K49_026253 [Saguinus oedipus]|uniref:V-type proton ATPase subunit G n=1 Tax=Saguinus oedipus TaxID=9490 RepID=A0ABQ9UEV7_SAGOE|nr:hypothetical protein P7K49_026253 [Saguinus oedipus]